MANIDNVDKVTNLHKNNELQILCFRLENKGNIYAVNVFKIREVVKHTGTVTLINHESSSLLEGVITIRDLTIPLIDLRKWFHYDKQFPTRDLADYAVDNEDVIVMICDFSRYTVGVRIYEADRILNKRWTDIEQSAGVGGQTTNSKLVSRTRYFDGSIVQIVDIEKMLTDAFPWIELEKEYEMNKIEEIPTEKIVLLADDSPSVLHTMQNILNRLGLQHVDFENGQRLLNFIKDPNTAVENIGMIITDLEMPEASGFEVIKQVKAEENMRHIPIIVNSSMSGSSNEEMAREMNADEFISKSNPLEIEMVARKYLLGAEA